ncbi:hypothetical protein ABIF42_007540 [Bradyrhizobium diazoefficiens]
MALGEMEHDRARFKQREIAVLEGRDLPERMQRKMRRLLHRRERDEADVVGLADFLQRPANPHVARLSPAAVGRAFEGGDGGHRGAPGWWRIVQRTNGPGGFRQPIAFSGA